MTKLESPYFTVVDPKPAKPRDLPPAFARGPAYRVEERGGEFTLRYISGELAGRAKELVITEQEARALRDDQTTLDAVLITHGAS